MPYALESTAEPDTEAPSLAALGRYVIEREIGRGMMGIIYKAHDPVLDRSVALKVINPSLPLPDLDRAALEERFLREASLAAGLSHPNIVVVHDVGCDGMTKVPFIALEYLEGRTLGELLTLGDVPDWRECVRIAASLAEALQHAQARGIVHRDIKPSNIMILPTGQPKILDFGIASPAAGELSGSDECWGSPAYMSPEQATGDPVDARTDLFSLGAVLYELLSGRRAFEGLGIPDVLHHVVNEDPPALSMVRPGLSSALDAVLARALAKNPTRRYQDGGQFAAALHAVLRAERDVATARSAVDTQTFRFRRVRTRNHRLLGAAAVLALVLVPLGFSRGGASRGEGSGALAAVGLSSALAEPAEATAAPSLPIPAPPPALLALSVEHSQKQGELKIYVDDAIALDRELVGKPTKKLLFLKRSSGTLATVMSVAPGERRLRIEVRGADGTRTRRLLGTFTSGASRTLRVKVGSTIETEWVS